MIDTITNTFTVLTIIAGVFFFIAGTVGLLRFGDVYCRLHALTKSDNLGLGLIALGLLPHASSFVDIVKIVLVWLLFIITSAVSCHLIARNEFRKENDAGQTITRGNN